MIQLGLTAVFFLVLLAVQGCIHPDFGDDLTYARVWMEKPLHVFLKDRYDWWSSRVVIEAVMMPLVAGNSLIWRALNIVMILLLVWITADLFGVRDKLEAQAIFFTLMWIVPLGSLSSAGWITTTVNYLWCLVLGLVAMRPIKHWLTEEKCPKWEYIVCPLCVLYAANMEQMGAILLGVYLVFGLYLLVDKRKLSPFYVAQLVLIVASLYFILSAPGNRNRTNQEIERFFPEFAEMGVGAKLLMGFLENAHYYIAGGHDKVCYLFACLAGVLFLCFAAKERGILRRLVAFCPLAAYWCCAHLFPFLLYEVNISRARNLFGVLSENRQVPGQSYFSGSMIAIQATAYLLVLVCVAVTIYFLHGKSSETLLQLLILGAGFTSRLIMGFSPTIYASGDRTAIFCSMAILIVVLRNLQLWLQRKPKTGWKLIMGAYVGCTIVLNLI